MKTLMIRDPEKLKLILQTFSALDHIRWHDARNYNPLNYSHDDLTPDEKLLTHWLCYITDRQTRFQRVWDVGGYVISDLVRAYTHEHHRDTREILLSYIAQEDGRLSLVCKLGRSDERLRRYGITQSPVRFASRYMPDDLVLMYRTLRILDAVAGRKLSGYIAAVIGGDDDHRRCIRRMASALDQLTYLAGRAVRADRFMEALDGTDTEVSAFVITPQEARGMFGRKRLWCSLRDYLKSPDFNTQFVAALASAQIPGPERWRQGTRALTDALSALELPGDVWNNAPVFREGLFSPYLEREPRAWDMPRTIRTIYELLMQRGPIGFYPEQLDVTFDFVPKMCEPQACDVCLFGAGVDRVCHGQSGRLCSVALVACGYRHQCDASACDLRADRVKGFCHRSLAAARVPCSAVAGSD